jgi:hypothetical protein
MQLMLIVVLQKQDVLVIKRMHVSLLLTVQNLLETLILVRHMLEHIVQMERMHLQHLPVLLENAQIILMQLILEHVIHGTQDVLPMD